MPCESGMWDAVPETLYLNPPIHTWATKECPHCGDFRHITGYLEELWNANDNDEVRYYLFHEPVQFLIEQAHITERIKFREAEPWKRKVYLQGRQKGQLHKVWGDGMGGWSKEFLELFPDGPDSLPSNIS